MKLFIAAVMLVAALAPSAHAQVQITISQPAEATTMDPGRSTQVLTVNYFYNLYDALTRWDNTLKLQPGLATPWKTVNETFYDPTFAGLDWPAIRDEYRAKLIAAASAEAARDVIRGMLGRLGTSHFGLISAASDRHTLPGEAVVNIEVRAIPEGVLVTRVARESAAERARVAAGDLVVEVDGVALAGARATDSRMPLIDAWQDANRPCSIDVDARLGNPMTSPTA